jgi:hypothetical protein
MSVLCCCPLNLSKSYWFCPSAIRFLPRSRCSDAGYLSAGFLLAGGHKFVVLLNKIFSLFYVNNEKGDHPEIIKKGKDIFYQLNNDRKNPNGNDSVNLKCLFYFSEIDNLYSTY